MPHDVTMPQLGMAQGAGRIVAWVKAPGDAVARGDVLFEVETDKATMEVEAQADGYLVGVSAAAGDDVPVGQVIARIADSPDEAGEAPGPAPPGSGNGTGGNGVAETGDDSGDDSGEALPDGHAVTMPQLGMAQDSGILVGWHKQPGDAVAADDVLFEVETDKSTMEVEAGREGYLAATLAEAGEEVPVGDPVAIISPEAPANPVARSIKQARAPTPPAEREQPDARAPTPTGQSPKADATAPAPSPGGRILASPKARRLALVEGLDLSRLAEAGHPQPYHVKDLDTLRAMPADVGPAAAVGTGAQSRHLTAAVPQEAFSAFAAWAADHAGLADAPALLAGLAGGCLDTDQATVAYEAFGRRRLFRVPRGPLSAVAEVEDGTPDLVLRDLRTTRMAGLRLGAEEAPTLTLTLTHSASGTDDGLTLTLECAAGDLSATAAVSLACEFAGRLEQPLRHLL